MFRRLWAWITRLFRRKKSTRPRLRDLPASTTHFYRYSTAQHLDWLRPVILQHEIWVPTAKELNDPAEAKPVLANISIEKIAVFLREMFAKNNPGLPTDRYETASREIDWLCAHQTNQELLSYMSKHLYALADTLRIFSMSKRWDNMALWAKYADNHRGYCLEFARTGLFNAAREVIYDDSFRFDVSNPEHATFDWYFCKTTEWTNEEEIRLVLSGRLMGGPVFRVGPECLTRIFLGKDMTDDDKTTIMAWAASRVPPVPVLNVRFDAFRRKLSL